MRRSLAAAVLPAAARCVRWPLLLGALLALLLAAATGSRAAEDPEGGSPVGLWQTVSDVDGKPKAFIRIREDNGEFVGVVEHIIDPAKRDALCDRCAGARHNQPVNGLTVLTGMHRDGDHFSGGQILDPDNGNVYSCAFTLTDSGRRLAVRGYLGISIFGRTQTWVRQQ